MEQKMIRKVRISFQRPDGLYPIEDGEKIHLLDEAQIAKLILLGWKGGPEWLCVRWMDPYLGMDKNDHKLCEAVQKHLNGETENDHVTGAWILNNRKNIQMIFGTPNAIQVKALSSITLEKIVCGGVLNEADKQDIINATKYI